MSSGWTSAARVETEHAGRYMRQMTSHFGHKVPTTCGEAEGSVAFDFGTCRFAVESDALILTGESASEEELARLEDVIAKHLVRFAWREELAIGWTRDAAQAA